MKDAVASRLDKVHNHPCKRFEERGFLPDVVNEEQFEVGGVSHLAASEFTKPEDGKGARPTAGKQRPAVSGHKFRVANSSGFLENDFAKVRQCVGEVR